MSSIFSVSIEFFHVCGTFKVFKKRLQVYLLKVGTAYENAHKMAQFS